MNKSMMMPPEREAFQSGSLADTDVAIASALAAGENEVRQAMIQARRNAAARLKAQNMVPSPEVVERLARKEIEETMRRRMEEAARRQERQPLAEGSTAEDKFPDLTGDGKVTQADVLKGRGVFQEGGSMMMPPEGMPVDTYPNIPEDEMEEAMASQLPDDEMEDKYIEYVMDESLDEDEQMYLAGVLNDDPKLSEILDKVIVTASEFSGAGEVDGPGTGVSDSIPARLSDGEFVFTKKATDQLGADNLQRMMDDAERAYDGGLQMMAEGGMMGQDEEELESQTSSLSKTDEEIKKLMMGSNRMPSLR